MTLDVGIESTLEPVEPRIESILETVDPGIEASRKAIDTIAKIEKRTEQGCGQ